MAYLKNTLNGRVVGSILPDSDVYEFLKGLKQAGVTGAPRPLYEEISRSALEHLLAGDDENQSATVAPLEDTGYQIMAKLVGPLAAGADATFQMGVADTSGNVTSVEYFPQAGVVGAATNFRTLSVSDATGPVTVASVALSSAPVVLTANQPNAIAIAAAAVVEGDVLNWKSIHTAAGLADPGGLVVVTLNGFSYTAADYSNAGYIDPFEGGEG